MRIAADEVIGAPGVALGIADRAKARIQGDGFPWRGLGWVDRVGPKERIAEDRLRCKPGGNEEFEP
jgi:hypothetical protein